MYLKRGAIRPRIENELVMSQVSGDANRTVTDFDFFHRKPSQSKETTERLRFHQNEAFPTQP